MNHKGKCLCGSVKFSFDTEKDEFAACHCKMCRNWGGSMAFAVPASGNIKFEGEENIKIFESSSFAERGFCKDCGSHLFYRFKDGSFLNFQLGVIDNHEKFKFVSQIYVDHKAENYSFANKTEMMTEAEVMALFGGE